MGYYPHYGQLAIFGLEYNPRVAIGCYCKRNTEFAWDLSHFARGDVRPRSADCAKPRSSRAQDLHETLKLS